MTTTTITLAELAANLDDVADRLRRGGERFTIEADGSPIGDLVPRAAEPKLTFHQLLDRLISMEEPDPDFAADVRAVREGQGFPREIDWPS